MSDRGNSLVNGERECAVESDDIELELEVVALADARSQPETVVIKAAHTDIAQVTVNGAWRSENQTSFAKFDRLCEHRGPVEGSLSHSQVEVALLPSYELV